MATFESIPHLQAKESPSQNPRVAIQNHFTMLDKRIKSIQYTLDNAQVSPAVRAEAQRSIQEIRNSHWKLKQEYLKLSGGTPVNVAKLNLEMKALTKKISSISIKPSGQVRAVSYSAPREQFYIPKNVDHLLRNGYAFPIEQAAGVREAGYVEDSGLDIAAPRGTRVVSFGNGQIVYSERGHTPWVADAKHPRDTANSVLIKLDKPLTINGQVIRTPNGQPVIYVWYTHLSALRFQVPLNTQTKPRVTAGTVVGSTGTGNNNDHLHLGFSSHYDQGAGQFLSMQRCREVLGLRAGESLGPNLNRNKV